MLHDSPLLGSPWGRYQKPSLEDYEPPAETVECCSVYKNANQDVIVGTATAVTWDAENFDDSAMHSTSSNTSRITVPTAGKYLFTAMVSRFNNQIATALRWYVNGAAQTGAGISNTYTYFSGTDGAVSMTILNLAANDYVELYIASSSNVTITYDIGGWPHDYSGVSNLSCVRVG